MENPNRTADYFARRTERLAALTQELRELFATTQSTTLEIGCGHGHFLTAYAQAHPNERCVGIDIMLDRVLRAGRKRHRAAVSNLTFIRAEASEFFLSLPATVRFDRYFILFPDPWPKRRHQKNRLIQEAFLTELSNRAGDKAALHFRTDHADYLTDARATVKAHPKWKLSDTQNWPFEFETVFQARAPSFQSLIANHQ